MRYREVVKVLQKNGWFPVRQKGSHVQFGHKDFRYCVTVVNHNGKDIAKGTLDQIAEATGLSFR